MYQLVIDSAVRVRECVWLRQFDTEDKLIQVIQVSPASRLYLTQKRVLLENRRQVKPVFTCEADDSLYGAKYERHLSLLLLNTYKNYYALNLHSLSALRIGSKEKQGRLGLCWNTA